MPPMHLLPCFQYRPASSHKSLVLTRPQAGLPSAMFTILRTASALRPFSFNDPHTANQLCGAAPSAASTTPAGACTPHAPQPAQPTDTTTPNGAARACSPARRPLCSVCSAPLTPEEVEGLLAAARAGGDGSGGGLAAGGGNGLSSTHAQGSGGDAGESGGAAGPRGGRCPGRAPLSLTAVLARGSCTSCRLHLMPSSRAGQRAHAAPAPLPCEGVQGAGAASGARSSGALVDGRGDEGDGVDGELPCVLRAQFDALRHVLGLRGGSGSSSGGWG